jgi:hypothetical protein
VAGSGECGDVPSGSGATELVKEVSVNCPLTLCSAEQLVTDYTISGANGSYAVVL